MTKGKHKNPTNKKQGHVATSEPSSPTTASPRYPNTPEKQEFDLKSYLMMLIDGFKKDLNNSLKEIQERAGEMAQRLRALTALLKVLSSNPSSHRLPTRDNES